MLKNTALNRIAKNEMDNDKPRPIEIIWRQTTTLDIHEWLDLRNELAQLRLFKKLIMDTRNSITAEDIEQYEIDSQRLGFRL